MTELLVDEYGYLFGGEDVLPVNTIDHDWRTPYPFVTGSPAFAWEPGYFKRRPNVFRHPEIRDWVCDAAATSVILALAPNDVRVLGHGLLNGDTLTIIQAVANLDIVDRESSIVETYPSYEQVIFPAFFRIHEDMTRNRIFRVPGAYTSVFVGRTVQDAFERAGLVGLRFTPVEFTDAGDYPNQVIA